MGKVYAVRLLVVDGNALGGNTILEHRAIPSIREIVGLTFIGALALFFIAEVVLAQDVPGRCLFTCAS
jgi:hypothetical protein